jgi:hypothetical protein
MTRQSEDEGMVSPSHGSLTSVKGRHVWYQVMKENLEVLILLFEGVGSSVNIRRNRPISDLGK